jgi:hypothetical protein
MAEGGTEGSGPGPFLAPLSQRDEDPLDAIGAMRQSRLFQLGTKRLRDRPCVTGRFASSSRQCPARIHQCLARSM